MAAFCCKPCEYLGKCIDKGCECGCKACGTLCSAPCTALGEFCCPVNAPSPIFLSYSVVVCGIPAVVAVTGIASGAADCGNIMIFFGAMIVINLMLIGFAFYLYKQFSKPYQGVNHQGHTEANALSRASNLFCYDPVVFVYLLTIVAGIVLSILGSMWSGGCKSSSATSTATTVSMLFWVYIFGGVFVICLSLCVECGRTQGVQVQPQHRPSGFLGIGGGGFVQRLFFPRANMMSVPAAGSGSGPNIPYAQPAPAHVQPPPQANYFPPQAQEYAANAPSAPPQQHGAAPTPAQQAAAAAAKGLRFGANMLQKASGK